MKTNKETLIENLADKVADVFGTWNFIKGQLIFIALWIGFNSIPKVSVDPYPNSFLNLILGVQASLSAPILLIAGKRQEEIDRKRAIENLEIDKISYDDLKRISKKIEEQFHHLDDDLEELKEDLEKS